MSYQHPLLTAQDSRRTLLPSSYLPQAAPPAPGAFLASLGISPSSETARAIADYLNGTARIVRDPVYAPSPMDYPAPHPPSSSGDHAWNEASSTFDFTATSASSNSHGYGAVPVYPLLTSQVGLGPSPASIGQWHDGNAPFPSYDQFSQYPSYASSPVFADVPIASGVPSGQADFVFDSTDFVLPSVSGEDDHRHVWSVPEDAFDFAASSGDYGGKQLEDGFSFDLALGEGPYATATPTIIPFSPESASSSPASTTSASSIPSHHRHTSSISSGSEFEFGHQHCSFSSQDKNKKHACPICHRAFARAYNLKAHSLTHIPNRAKPFACPHAGCGRTFSRSHDRERHRAGIHQDGPLHDCGTHPASTSTTTTTTTVAGSKARKRSARGVSSA